MNDWKKGVSKYATDLVMIGGAAAVVVGIGLIYVPAGMIAAGILAMAGATDGSRGPERKPGQFRPDRQAGRPDCGPGGCRY